MKCRESQELLQCRLDGSGAPMSPGWKSHLEECATCRADFAAAQLLAKGLTRKRPTTTLPAAALTSRIVTRVLDDRHKRQFRSKVRWYAIWTMAASLLLIVGLTNFFPRQEAVAVRPMPTTGEGLALDQRIHDAQDAVVSLTERMAEKTKENAKLWSAAASPMELPGLPTMDEWDLEPAAQSLQRAGRAFSASLEPMARSAAQAVNFFSREWSAFDLPSNQ